MKEYGIRLIMGCRIEKSDEDLIVVMNLSKPNWRIKLVILLTILLFFWPDFHPERYLFNKYYWQVDFLIHFIYLFLITLIITQATSINVFMISGGLIVVILAEIVQCIIPGRSSSVLDVFSNTLGFLLGLFVGNIKKR